jgi:uncharacterized integral membrane protein (TIGR00698 family)
MSALGVVTPPLSLACGIFLALTLGNPFETYSQTLSKKLLQLSVIGLGFGMNLTAIFNAGRVGFILTITTILGTLLLGYILGLILKISSNTSLLISSGTAICGGSAIAAVGGVIGADKKDMTVSLGTIFLLNAVALFIFPLIGEYLEMSQNSFGLWSAIAIHDTSSVVGAASKYGDQALEVATSVKLARALFIFPISFVIALSRKKEASSCKFPWFILFFLLVATFCTLFPQGEEYYGWLKIAAKRGLTITLFLIGANLSKDTIKRVGIRPMLQGVILWVCVALASIISIRTFDFFN